MIAKKNIIICVLLTSNVTHASADHYSIKNKFAQAPYGFYFEDIGITQKDITLFNQLNIQQTKEYNIFGQFDDLEKNVNDFLRIVGDNNDTLVEFISHKVTCVVGHIIELSGQETAWLSLRCYIPTSQYDIPRWHMDGSYYNDADPTKIKYKCAITVKGAPTLFYQIPQEDRRAVRTKTNDRKYLQAYCKQELTQSPQQGQAAFFIGGKTDRAALHSEPPIHEQRFFISIIPCNKKQLMQLKGRALALVPNSEKLTA